MVLKHNGELCIIIYNKVLFSREMYNILTCLKNPVIFELVSFVLTT